MGQIAIITGASRGIGAATARRMAREGYRLVLGYCHSGERAKALREELSAMGAEVCLCRADVAVEQEAAALIQCALDTYGGLDVLINNAGIAEIKLFTDITPEDWRRMFAVNVDGIFHTCRAAVPIMVRQHSGSIVNVSSIWGLTGASCEVHYSAAKAAVIGFTKALAKELGPSFVRVNCVAPGAMDTEMNAHLTDEERKMLEEEIPLCRMGTPEEAAAAIVFLASEQAGYITGQVLSPNGGIVI